MFFGLVGWPISSIVFSKWEDKGYLLAKSVGLLTTTYVVWLLAGWKIWTYGTGANIFWGVIIGLAGIILKKRLVRQKIKIDWKLILVEELLFLTALTGWAWIKAHEPTINGLEKFMDYGFTKSIQRSSYFPPQDMWYAGETINYYYFGHTMMASLSLVSGVNLEIGFNLMLATLFAMCLTMSFAIGRELWEKYPRKIKLAGGLLTALLVTISGNLHTIYAFTKGYWGAEDNPPPFWEILQPLNREKIAEGFANYWYPNATRFIPYTIHEFPSYSFVVSDIHGHVLSIPISLLGIALLVQFFIKQSRIGWREAGIYGIVAGTALMTNALDGPIYIGLFALLLLARRMNYSVYDIGKLTNWTWLRNFGLVVATVAGVFALSVWPFLANFKPFVNGVAVNCPPAFLANTKIGPLIFESTANCQKSPWWMLLILWGFFLYTGLGLTFLDEEKSETRKVLLLGSVFSFGLIIFAEFFYFKDIYPQHFRSNTMFKLGYQAFILMSIVSSFTIIKLAIGKINNWTKKIYLLGLVPLLFLVLLYPYFGVKSYFNSLREFKGVYGLDWMRERYPEYYLAIRWINKYIPGQPVILEAAGDSYTDNNLVSAFTGLPTVTGWAVHEWLWRGSYEPVAQRANDVATIYGSGNETATRRLIDEYNIEYIVLGEMERKKYPNLDEQKIATLGRPVFVQGGLKIYKL